VLLNTLRPSWVLIQSGYRNRFHHPAPVVLERYRERSLRWVNTPQCGAATWRSDVPLGVHCERASDRRYWHHLGADMGVRGAASVDVGPGSERPMPETAND
jgi:competence protein ComEC